ncbi:MAG TPA: alanyl-tRNA editing protein [Paraburkholderia sp.]|nr:alanyl-tRNA editing protein [Paraburkholderia sp.]
MFSLDRKTRKLFYEDPLAFQHTAKVVKVGADFVELDQTVAYPEGGGQDPDHGEFILPDGRRLRFVHVRKMYGNRAPLAGFPDISVDGVIEHVVCAEDLPDLQHLQPGMDVTVRIDRLRRAQLSLSHTASHLLYLGIGAVRPAAIAETIGCHIAIESARFDFWIAERFTPDEIEEISQLANAYIGRNSAVETYAHEAHQDARYWRCEGQVIPCGGTHIASTGWIAQIEVRRKSVGKGKERVSCTFPAARADLLVDSCH